METSTIWWLLAGAAIALELLTGTFYLLMFAFGLVGAALAAHAGLTLPAQIVIAAVVGATAVGLWRARQQNAQALSRTESNSDLHLDIGATVDVLEWTASQASQVLHRGASWSAKPSPQGLQDHIILKTGSHRIVGVDGNTLLLEKI